MALRDRILNFQQVATATPATLATPNTEGARTVATVATVAVAREEKTKKGLANGEDLPAPCHDCPSCEILTFGGREVAGCVQKLPFGPWREEWQRMDSLTHCPKQKPTIH